MLAGRAWLLGKSRKERENAVPRQNHLAAIHRLKGLCEIQVGDCETPEKSKTQKSPFEKANLYSMSWLTVYGPGCRPKQPPPPMDSASAPLCCGPAAQFIFQENQKEPCPFVSPVTGQLAMNPTVDL
ncbi:hypothetical protein H8959_012857 [Pygathrix nigripes]